MDRMDQWPATGFYARREFYPRNLVGNQFERFGESRRQVNFRGNMLKPDDNDVLALLAAQLKSP
jgi:hypothetical protein